MVWKSTPVLLNWLSRYWFLIIPLVPHNVVLGVFHYFTSCFHFVLVHCLWCIPVLLPKFFTGPATAFCLLSVHQLTLRSYSILVQVSHTVEIIGEFFFSVTTACLLCCNICNASTKWKLTLLRSYHHNEARILFLFTFLYPVVRLSWLSARALAAQARCVGFDYRWLPAFSLSSIFAS